MAWALVTGGAKGIGKAICQRLAQDKRNLVIHYRHSSQEAQALAVQLRAYKIAVELCSGDFSTVESTQRFFQEYIQAFPSTDLLINNIGNYLLGSALVTSANEVLTLFQTNVLSALIGSQLLAPSLKQHQGHIVNIGMVGSDRLLARTEAWGYDMTKVSLYMLTQTLAKELAPFQVCVNMVSPGYIDTSLVQPVKIDSIPWGRLGTSEEIAEVVSFLTQPTQRYITGQNIAVAGGVRL